MQTLYSLFYGVCGSWHLATLGCQTWLFPWHLAKSATETLLCWGGNALSQVAINHWPPMAISDSSGWVAGPNGQLASIKCSGTNIVTYHIRHSWSNMTWASALDHGHMVDHSILHSPNGSFDSRWNSNLSLLHWIDNSTQNFTSIRNYNFEFNWQSNAANSSWNFKWSVGRVYPSLYWDTSLFCHAEVDLHEGHAFETGTHEGPPTNVFNLVCLLGIRSPAGT